MPSNIKFCDKCSRVMERSYKDDDVIFTCYCGEMIIGSDEDRQIFIHYEETENTMEMYSYLIETAALDRTCAKVLRECEQCSAPFMCLVRLGSEELTLFVCKCGNCVKSK